MQTPQANSDVFFEAMQASITRLVNLQDEAWNDFRNLFVYKTLPTDAYFIKAGEKAENIAFVIEGVVREFYVTREGSEFNKAFILSGGFTGSYFDLLSGTESTAYIQALTPTQLLVAPFAEYTQLFERHHCIERMGRRVIERLFINKAQREYEFLTLDATQRYKNLIQRQPLLEQCVPQYHIASYLGITPVALSRLKRALKPL